MAGMTMCDEMALDPVATLQDDKPNLSAVPGVFRRCGGQGTQTEYP